MAAKTEAPSAQDPGGPGHTRLWGGRFAAGPSRAVEDFTSSLAVDRRLYREDVAGSIAHARMLGAAGIIPRTDAQKLIRGLQGVRKEFDEGRFEFVDGDEDIHTAVERRLHELLGPEVGGKLHTGRSRNDQVALDLRMYAKNAIVDTGEALCRLQAAMVRLAGEHRDSILPALAKAPGKYRRVTVIKGL